MQESINSNPTSSTYHVIGLMSGTSGDGVDLAYCRLEFDNGKWKHRILEAATYGYDVKTAALLEGLMNAGTEALKEAHDTMGRHFGELINAFIKKHKLKAGLIASHGHTIFHQPDKGITFQAGNGAIIASVTGIETVSDFRSLDVTLGGQGAPLVPVGDEYLFGEYAACLNLGGIANISYLNRAGKRIAFDICPANMSLNYLAAEAGRDYDDQGRMAQAGTVDPSLLEKLNTPAYYSQPPPKSLGREWFNMHVKPLLDDAGLPVRDRLRTTAEHIAMQVGDAVHGARGGLLVTGGGAFNTFLMERITACCDLQPVVPDEITVKYKEALIFALLGVLRKRNEINTFRSVTGASRDSSGGTVYQAPGK